MGPHPYCRRSALTSGFPAGDGAPPVVCSLMICTSGLRVPPGSRVAFLDVVVEEREEVADDGVALEGQPEGAVDVDRRLWFFKGAGKRDADVGVLGFAGTVYDAAHHGHAQILDAGVARLPQGHLIAKVR